MPLSRRALFWSAGAVGLGAKTASAQPLVQPFPTFPPSLDLTRPIRALAVQPRLNVSSLAAASKTLVSFRAAITAMQALPASNPRSWEAQAQTHQNHCAHRNWYTWVWHRAFLLQFERICQSMSGDPTFRVPYWDWTAHRQLPATFTATTFNGAPNPLSHSRTQSPNASLPDSVVGTAVVNAILAEPNFEAFMSRRPSGQTDTSATWQRTPSLQGPMESNPHNTIHGWIGGDMGSFLSPRDPIFWLHHSNLDRLWQRWNTLGNANTNDALWRDFQFASQFVTPTGTPYAPRVKDLLSIQVLGYTYDQPQLFFPLPPIVRTVPTFDWNRLQRTETAVPQDTRASLAEPASIVMRTTDSVAKVAARSMAAAAPSTGPTIQGGASPTGATKAALTAGRVLALIDASIPDNAPSPLVRVFLNCDYLTADTPSVDPHYVGSFSFFGMGGMAGMPAMAAGGGAQADRFVLDLTRTLVALGGADKLPTDQLKLQFQPTLNGPAGSGSAGAAGSATPTPVTVHRVEIAVS
jgi:tyrosinase